MAVTIDVADVITEWGAYYVNQGQNASNLRSKIYQPSETDKYFALHLTEDTQIRNVSVEMDEVLQAYQDAFTPKGDMVFAPVEIDLFPQKIDWEKNPNQFVENWLGFLAGEDIDRANWPIIRYIIEQHLLKRRDMDYETKAVFLGAYEAPVAGTAGPAIKSMNGIRKIIRLWNTATRSTPIATGALETDPADFVTQIEDFIMGIPVEIRDLMSNIFIDKDLMKRYKDGMRAKYNTNYAQSASLTHIEDAQNIEVTGLVSMKGSEMIWGSIPENMGRWEKRSKNQNGFKVESAKRTVSIMSDWHKGVGFKTPELIFHNDRDLV